jgi:hypothetical protein
MAIHLGIGLEARGVNLYRREHSLGHTYLKRLIPDQIVAHYHWRLRRYCFDQMLIALAGPVAERLFAGEKLRVADSDLHNALHGLAFFHGRKVKLHGARQPLEYRLERMMKRDKAFARAARKTRALLKRRCLSILRRHRKVILALANELYSRKRMSGLAVTRFVNRHLRVSLGDAGGHGKARGRVLWDPGARFRARSGQIGRKRGRHA